MKAPYDLVVVSNGTDNQARLKLEELNFYHERVLFLNDLDYLTSNEFHGPVFFIFFDNVSYAYNLIMEMSNVKKLSTVYLYFDNLVGAHLKPVTSSELTNIINDVLRNTSFIQTIKCIYTPNNDYSLQSLVRKWNKIEDIVLYLTLEEKMSDTSLIVIPPNL